MHGSGGQGGHAALAGADSGSPAPVTVPAAQVIAHRGWQRRYPENTLRAIEGALAAGARGIEIDLQLDGDRRPVLCHDPTLERLCGDPVDITRATAAHLARLSAHEPGRLGPRFAGTPLARLDEVVPLLARHPGVTLYAEIKRHSLRRHGAAAVLDAVLPPLQAIAPRCVLLSFDLPVLQAARGRGWRRVAPVLSDWAQAGGAEVAALAPGVIFCDKEKIAPAQSLAGLPAPLAIYEIDDAAEARAWLERGAGFVESFACGELLGVAPAAEGGDGR